MHPIRWRFSYTPYEVKEWINLIPWFHIDVIKTKHDADLANFCFLSDININCDEQCHTSPIWWLIDHYETWPH